MADPPLRIRPGDVEVAQGAVTEIGRGGEVRENPFDHDLRGAVRVDRSQRRLFVDGNLLRDAVNGGRRGVDEARDARLAHRLQEVQGMDDVVAVVGEGFADRFVHLDRGGEVHDRLGTELLKRVQDRVPVGEVAAPEAAGEDGPFVAGGEVVVDQQVMALFSRGS